jgi:hypothetical protein
MSGYSLSWLMREREELQRDRYAFASALDTLKKRILESNETDIPRRPLLHEWSGTRAAVGSLEMALHATERALEETNQLILAIENGEELNSDVPKKELKCLVKN